MGITWWFSSCQPEWSICAICSSNLLTRNRGVPNIYERSDLDVRLLEGLSERTGVLAGLLHLKLVIFTNMVCSSQVDLMSGQKTGFYLDQRENRHKIGAYAQGARDPQLFLLHRGFHGTCAGRRRYLKS